jgi:hypothetical protein
MDETQEKSVIESESKEKIGDAIDQLDLLRIVKEGGRLA